jgi:adenylylsulfate kinase
MNPDEPSKHENLFWSPGTITIPDREKRNGHPGLVVWFTGLSCSGKSTIARELERELFKSRKQVCVLDGDNVRQGLCRDLGFAEADRHEHMRRVGEVAKLFADAGLICIVALISPYRIRRDAVRTALGPNRFVEIYLEAPIEVCERRDFKGLYAKARAGLIHDFTGVSAPYEPPLQPELKLRTDCLTVPESVAEVRRAVEQAERALGWHDAPA